MTNVGISLRMTGAMAFFAVLVLAGTWATVTLGLQGLIDIRSVGLVLAFLYILSGLVVFFIWAAEHDAQFYR